MRINFYSFYVSLYLIFYSLLIIKAIKPEKSKPAAHLFSESLQLFLASLFSIFSASIKISGDGLVGVQHKSDRRSLICYKGEVAPSSTASLWLPSGVSKFKPPWHERKQTNTLWLVVTATSLASLSTVHQQRNRFVNCLQCGISNRFLQLLKICRLNWR